VAAFFQFRIDEGLEKAMEKVLDIVVLGRAARNAGNIKNRQPIAKMYARISAKNTDDKRRDTALDEFYIDIIRDELNIKEVVFTDDIREFTSYTFKPQLKTVGPKYGKQLGGIKAKLSSLDGNAAMDELNEKGSLIFDVDGVRVELGKDDLLIEVTQKEGFISQDDRGTTVVLDGNLTKELLDEGFANEVVSKVQTTRKDSGLEVMDRIRLSVTGSARIIEVVKEKADFIGTKVLADEILYDRDVPGAKEWNINGETAKIGVQKI